MKVILVLVLVLGFAGSVQVQTEMEKANLAQCGQPTPCGYSGVNYPHQDLPMQRPQPHQELHRPPVYTPHASIPVTEHRISLVQPSSGSTPAISMPAPTWTPTPQSANSTTSDPGYQPGCGLLAGRLIAHMVKKKHQAKNVAAWQLADQQEKAKDTEESRKRICTTDYRNYWDSVKQTWVSCGAAAKLTDGDTFAAGQAK